MKNKFVSLWASLLLVGVFSGCSVDPVTSDHFKATAQNKGCNKIDTVDENSTSTVTARCPNDCTVHFITAQNRNSAYKLFEGFVQTFFMENDIKEVCKTKKSGSNTTQECTYQNTKSHALANLISRHYLQMRSSTDRLIYVHQVENTVFYYSGSYSCEPLVNDLAERLKY